MFFVLYPEYEETTISSPAEAVKLQKGGGGKGPGLPQKSILYYMYN